MCARVCEKLWECVEVLCECVLCTCVCVCARGCVGVCSSTSRDLSKRASFDRGQRGEMGSCVKKAELVM